MKEIFPKSSTICYQLATLYATNLLTLFFKLAEAIDASVNQNKWPVYTAYENNTLSGHNGPMKTVPV